MRNRFRISIVLGIVLFLSLGMAGCATVGPTGAKGHDAVVCGQVRNSSPFFIDPADKSFYVISKDTTGMGLNMKNDIARVMFGLGYQQASRAEKAGCVIDAISENYAGGKVGGSAITDDTDAVNIAIGSFFDQVTPSYAGFQLNLVVDVLKQTTEEKNPKKTKKVKTTEPEYDRHETILSTIAKYSPIQATEDDALAVVKSRLLGEFANSFK